MNDTPKKSTTVPSEAQLSEALRAQSEHWETVRNDDDDDFAFPEAPAAALEQFPARRTLLIDDRASLVDLHKRIERGMHELARDTELVIVGPFREEHDTMIVTESWDGDAEADQGAQLSVMLTSDPRIGRYLAVGAVDDVIAALAADKLRATGLPFVSADKLRAEAEVRQLDARGLQRLALADVDDPDAQTIALVDAALRSDDVRRLAGAIQAATILRVRELEGALYDVIRRRPSKALAWDAEVALEACNDPPARRAR